MAWKLAIIMHAMRRDGTVCADRLHAAGMSDGVTAAKDASFWAPSRSARTVF
jgi:hypothetical protein